MKEKLKNSKKKIIISGAILIVLIMVVCILLNINSSVNSIKKVSKVLDSKYYSITCINSNCNYIEALKGDKLKKTTTEIYDSNGKKIAKYVTSYNAKDKTDKIVQDVTNNYLIFKEVNRSNYEISKYDIAKKNGKILYKTKNTLNTVSDSLVNEKVDESGSYTYTILNYSGKVLYTKVNTIDSYSNNKIISLTMNSDSLLIDNEGNKILDGYKVDKEIFDEDNKSSYMIVEDTKGNSFYYFDTSKNQIVGDGFQNYTVDAITKECIVEKNENNSVVKYTLKSNGKQVKLKNTKDRTELIKEVNEELDSDTYTLYQESVINNNQKNVLVDNKKENSFGIYELKSKKYKAIYNYKEGSYKYSTIYKLASENEKTYLQITCNNANCETARLYVYDLNESKILYQMEDETLTAQKYTQYEDGYKVIKYSYATTKQEYKGKYVLYDKNNKELIKSSNPIVVIDKKYVFGSTDLDRAITLYSAKNNKQLNTDDSSASKIDLSNVSVYKYNDNDYTYILSTTGKELVKIENSIKLVYSSDTISYIDKDNIYIVNIKNSKTKKYKLKDNEKINDSRGDIIPPYKNSLIVNNSTDKYIKIINFNGSVVKKIKKQEVYQIKQSNETSNVLIITKKINKNKIYYGLFIAK